MSDSTPGTAGVKRRTTNIGWTEATWNPTTGCDRTSPGCDNCYALTLAGRLKAMGQAKYQRDGDPRTSGPGFGLTLHPDTLQIPLRRKAPTTYFVNSMSDLFHQDVPDEFVAQVFDVMLSADQHTYQVLTKRARRMRSLTLDWFATLRIDWRNEKNQWVIPPWIWLGVSIESDRYCFRAGVLRDTPAAVRFLSLEPLLGPLPTLDLADIDWVIVGGESGPQHRTMQVGWLEDIVDRCDTAGVPVYVKQDSGRWPGKQGRLSDAVWAHKAYPAAPSSPGQADQ